MEIETLELVTIQGDVIEIEYPNTIMEEFLNDFNDSCSRDDYWQVGNWTDARAMFKGIQLDNIDMKKIIGTR